jgi:hypothetical protein
MLAHQGTYYAMFAIIAVVLFAIATLIAFTSLSGISVLGLIAAGLLCIALHLAIGGTVTIPWHRQP